MTLRRLMTASASRPTRQSLLALKVDAVASPMVLPVGFFWNATWCRFDTEKGLMTFFFLAIRRTIPSFLNEKKTRFSVLLEIPVNTDIPDWLLDRARRKVDWCPQPLDTTSTSRKKKSDDFRPVTRRNANQKKFDAINLLKLDVSIRLGIYIEGLNFYWVHVWFKINEF